MLGSLSLRCDREDDHSLSPSSPLASRLLFTSNQKTIPAPSVYIKSRGGELNSPLQRGCQGHGGNDRDKVPKGRCAREGNPSRAMTGRQHTVRGAEGGWRTAFRVVLRRTGESRGGGGSSRGSPVVPGLLSPYAPPRPPSRWQPPRPRAEGSARLPPRSPALSRVLCRPFQWEGEGARRELLQWSTERTLPQRGSQWKATAT